MRVADAGSSQMMMGETREGGREVAAKNVFVAAASKWRGRQHNLDMKCKCSSH